jgi:hypothetical protein
MAVFLMLPIWSSLFGPPLSSKLSYFFLAFLRGTFPPARRACERPMAIACLRLVTFLPERPLLKVPRLRSRIAFLTFCDAFLPYLAIVTPFKSSIFYDTRPSIFASNRRKLMHAAGKGNDFPLPRHIGEDSFLSYGTLTASHGLILE